jgi:prolipoprotein diacylglyceryltransferase
MLETILLAGLTLGFVVVYRWAFRALPREQWQMAAAIPLLKEPSGRWRGVNLTWYGILTANAYVFAVAMLLVLLGSVGIASSMTIALTALLLAICIPASKLLARIIDRKPNTFTVAGAIFVGTLAGPAAVALCNALSSQLGTAPIPMLPALSAMAIAMLFGEGLGRLACLSFGCCYGKPLDQTSGLMRRMLSGWGVTFCGSTKKSSYEGHCEGRRLIPIQAMTAVILTGTGLVCVPLFLRGWHATALLLSMTVSQVWRLASEFFRADNRGAIQAGTTVYQKMAPVALACTALFAWCFQGAVTDVNLSSGLSTLWHPAVLLTLQILWATMAVYTGRSRVTGSTVEFHVLQNQI